MRVQEYSAYLNKILARNLFLRKQINALSIISIQYIIEKNHIGIESKCIFDFQDLWKDYSLKLRKCIYFLEQYCNGLLKEMELINKMIHIEVNDISVAPSSYAEEAIFNFDALILSTSAVIDYEERDYLATQFKKVKICTTYPDRKDIGLYWQLNILRNRIIHHTGGRFANNNEECQRFLDFSSMIQIIRVTHGNLSLRSTQIDVYKEDVKCILSIAIKSGKNIFDVLFPNKSGKGLGKKHPTMIIPSKDIYFDHANAGINMIFQIQDFVCKLNQAFFDEFYYKIKQTEKLLNLCIVLNHCDQSYQYKIKDIFECNNG